MPTDKVPSAAANELLADEVAELALADPEDAAQLVAAVAPERPATGPSVSPTSQLRQGPSAAMSAAGRPAAEQCITGALGAVLLLQVAAASRARRLLLALVGAGLLAALVTRAQKP